MKTHVDKTFTLINSHKLSKNSEHLLTLLHRIDITHPRAFTQNTLPVSTWINQEVTHAGQRIFR